MRATQMVPGEVERRIRKLPDGCWEWTGARFDRNPYGRIKVQGRSILAHRFSYEIFVGPIPEGLTLDHLCRNPICVNPQHLEPVTAGENVLRGNTVTGRNSRKTHCTKGHSLSGENLHLRPDGRRLCWECHLAGCRRRSNDDKYRAYHAAKERELRARRKAMKMMARQGDVLVFTSPKSARGLKIVPRESGRIILAWGEVTNHAHAISAPEAALYALNESTLDRLLKVKAPVALRHEEHREIQLPAATYIVRRQREYSPLSSRLVAD